MKESFAKKIQNIICDYRNEDGIFISEKDILAWVKQFADEEQNFILEELLHLLNQGIYLSKSKAKEFLHNNIQDLAKHFKYARLSDFLVNTHFINIQKEGKSQSAIIALMDEVLTEKYNFSVAQCGTKSPKHFIYLDDVLATGSTFCRDMEKWFSETTIKNKKAIELFSNKQIDIIASYFCYHTWGWGNAQFVLSKKLNTERLLKGIILQHDFEIQNNLKFSGQKLNCIIPTNIDENATSYLAKLSVNSNLDRATRPSRLPMQEHFFSSHENRIRFENIMLHEGIKIISRIENLSVQNIRPLGYTIKSHQTFGLGTTYFTWRNISNTCPLIFWWDNNGWKGLFPLKNRGIKKIES
jgi:hypothetical protein